MPNNFLKDRVQNSRFSTLYIDPDEYLFEIVEAQVRTDKKDKSVPPKGSLIIASKSIIFTPEDHSLPVIKCMLKDVHEIGKTKGNGLPKKLKAIQLNCDRVLQLQQQHTESNDASTINTMIIVLQPEDFDNVKTRLDALFKISKSDNSKGLSELIFSYEQSMAFNQVWMDSTGNEEIRMETSVTLFSHFEQIRGRVTLTNNNIWFQPFTTFKNEPQYYRIAFASIRSVLRQRYLLEDVAMDVHLIDNTSYFFVFDNITIRDNVATSIGITEKDAVSTVQQKWTNREITNYDYIMYLNEKSGRTIHSIDLYPIFPWVIADYSSNELDLENKQTFRNLKKPIGGQKGNNGPYTTYISTPASVVYFLARVHPDLALQHSKQLSDTFTSVKNGYESSISTPKELVPEFYQGEGEFLTNVMLPPWADTPATFVKKSNQALESDYVSKHLHEWIDMVFGYKSTTGNMYPSTCQIPTPLFKTAHPVRKLPTVQSTETKITEPVETEQTKLEEELKKYKDLLENEKKKKNDKDIKKQLTEKNKEIAVLQKKLADSELKNYQLKKEIVNAKPKGEIAKPGDLKIVNKYIQQLERELQLAKRDEQQRMKELENAHKELLQYRNKVDDGKERNEKYRTKLCELKQLHTDIHDLNVQVQELELDNRQKDEQVNRLLMMNNDYEEEIRHMKSEVRAYAQTVFALEKLFHNNHSSTFDAFHKHLAAFAGLSYENTESTPRQSPEKVKEEEKAKASDLIFMRHDVSKTVPASPSNPFLKRTQSHASMGRPIRVIPDITPVRRVEAEPVRKKSPPKVSISATVQQEKPERQGRKQLSTML